MEGHKKWKGIIFNLSQWSNVNHPSHLIAFFLSQRKFFHFIQHFSDGLFNKSDKETRTHWTCWANHPVLRVRKKGKLNYFSHSPAKKKSQEITEAKNEEKMVDSVKFKAPSKWEQERFKYFVTDLLGIFQ